MSENKVYCGSGKEKFDGNLVDVVLCLSDLPKDKIFEYGNKKYIKLKVGKKKETDKYGKTHYVEVDMFEPEKKQEAKPEPKQAETGLPQSDLGGNYGENDYLPF
jgi:hypothetical protein